MVFTIFMYFYSIDLGFSLFLFIFAVCYLDVLCLLAAFSRTKRPEEGFVVCIFLGFYYCRQILAYGNLSDWIY